MRQFTIELVEQLLIRLEGHSLPRTMSAMTVRYAARREITVTYSNGEQVVWEFVTEADCIDVGNALSDAMMYPEVFKYACGKFMVVLYDRGKVRRLIAA